VHITAPGTGHGWHVDPPVALLLVAGAWSYARGVRTLWTRAGRGRGLPPWRVGAFAAGLVTLAIALQSPVDTIAADLFAMHMVQHLLLMMVAAPLLALGEPAVAMTWALPARARRRFAPVIQRGRPLRRIAAFSVHPVVALGAHVLALWLWHLPRAYDAAVRSPGVHIAEHFSFLGTAILFWWNVCDARRRRRLGMPIVVAYLFAAGLQGTVLGALISMARTPWYSAHLATTGPWGFTPLEDQQLAGLIMWVPAGLVYLVVTLSLAAASLRRPRVAPAAC
jgi:putative membrane protein